MNFKKEKKDFSNKNLKEFPLDLLKSRKCRKLFLQNNDIKRLPEVISKLELLETLDLTGNKIRTLYAKMFDLQNLRILILRNNEIINIPKQIKLLKKLKILNLANNKLKSLPSEIRMLESLEELNISGNQFSEFPEEIFAVKGLKALWIGQNNFTDFPIERILNEMPNLKKLYCYSYLLNNDDKNISSMFLDASKVKGNCLQYFRNTMINAINSDEIKSQPQFNNQTIKYPTQNMKKIFISYAHGDDKQWLNRVKSHLKVLQLEGIEIEVWDDTKIKAGTSWEEEIKKELNQAIIGILLISTHFLGSDFISKNELPPLLKSAQANGTLILPLIITPCRFLKSKNLKGFQAVNDPNKSLLQMSESEQEIELIKLADRVEEYIESIKV